MALAATIPVVRKTWTPDVHIDRKAADDGQPDSYTFRFTSDALDRDGEIISADGWDFGAYEKNPVILDSHNNGGGLFGGGAGVEVIIGRAVPPLRQVDNAWEADIVFADTPRGQLAKQLVDGGFLRTVSVGFRSLEQRRKPNEPLVHLAKELLEISLVAIPSNREAVRVRSAGDESKDFNGTLLAAEARADLRDRYRNMFTVLRHCLDSCIGDPEKAIPDKIRDCDGNLGQFHAAMNQWVADWLALPPMDEHEHRAAPADVTKEPEPTMPTSTTLSVPVVPFTACAVPAAVSDPVAQDVTKAGRVLSAANMARIGKALEAGEVCCAELEALLASVEQAPESQEETGKAATPSEEMPQFGEPETPAAQAADPPEQKGEVTEAAEEPPVLDLDLALLGQLIRR